MARRFLLLGLVMALSSLAPAADWTRFRGPNGSGISTDALPSEWKESDYLWKVTIPGVGNSSPIVCQGKIFLQSATADGQQRRLICFDAKTGKVLWNKEVAARPIPKEQKIHPLNSTCSSTPATDGERVYTIFWDGRGLNLIAWDYEGKTLWNKELGTFASEHGAGLSPVVYGGKVYVNLDQDRKAEIIAFDAKTGEEKWRQKRQPLRACYTCPAILEGQGQTQLIVANTSGITSYHPDTGKENWHWEWVFTGKKGGLRNVGGPILHEGVVYALSGDGGGDRHMVAVTSDGNKKLLWEAKKGTPYVPSPIAMGNYLFWVTDKEGTAVCVDAKTGKELWAERLGGGGQFFSSPVLAKDKIYAINEKGTVFVFKASGDAFERLGKIDLKETVIATPAIADGKLIIRGEKHLYCVGKQ
jgi:outer membrane protein assembly factor BamB